MRMRYRPCTLGRTKVWGQSTVSGAAKVQSPLVRMVVASVAGDAWRRSWRLAHPAAIRVEAMHGAPHLQPMNCIVVRQPVNQALKGIGLLERMLQTSDEPAAVFFLCSHGCTSFALSVHGPGASRVRCATRLRPLLGRAVRPSSQRAAAASRVTMALRTGCRETMDWPERPGATCSGSRLGGSSVAERSRAALLAITDGRPPWPRGSSRRGTGTPAQSPGCGRPARDGRCRPYRPV